MCSTFLLDLSHLVFNYFKLKLNRVSGDCTGFETCVYYRGQLNKKEQWNAKTTCKCNNNA